MSCAALTTSIADAYAVREPRPIKLDHRVRTVMYQPDEVVKFIGHYGFQSAIEFEDGETIETISMGDATGWLLSPVGNRLFVKPVDQDATTNMTLITNRRTYLMELHAREAAAIDDEEMVFIMRFIYPGQVAESQAVSTYMDSVPIEDALENPEKYNFAYTISGPDRLSPIRIFDDGEFTYFEFRDKNADIPAFFLVDSMGNESIINYRMRGNYVVVERVGGKFTLRYGKEIVCVFNETRTPSGDPKPKSPVNQSTPAQGK
jgi:type IV secretion system protein VirB9